MTAHWWPAGHRSLVVLACALASLAGTVAAGGRGTLMLVERPDRLVMLNKYQQNATAGEKALLHPFVPITLVVPKDLLSDGITPCARVMIHGQQFFLLRERNGRLAGEALAGAISYHEGMYVAGDTVRVLRGNSVWFTPAGQTRQSLAAAGERLVRIFVRGSQTFVMRPGETPPYGWVELPARDDGRTWSAGRAGATVPSGLPPRITNAVLAALAAGNARFKNVFAFLNARGERQKTAPEWDLTADGDVLRCTLLGASSGHEFPETTRYLMRTVEHALAGTGYRIVPTDAGFDVRPG